MARKPVLVIGEQQSAADDPLPEKIKRPQEWNAIEVAQEQRGIADRKQGSANVAHKEDEEDDGVNDALAFGIRLEQGTDEQHAGPGGADEAGEERPGGEKAGIGDRMSGQVTAQADAAADDVQAEQQHDERDVFGDDGVFEDRPDLMDAADREAVQGGQSGADQRDRKPVEIALPPMVGGGNERQERDGAEDADEGQNAKPPVLRHVNLFKFDAMAASIERLEDEQTNRRHAGNDRDPGHRIKTWHWVVSHLRIQIHGQLRAHGALSGIRARSSNELGHKGE